MNRLTRSQKGYFILTSNWIGEHLMEAKEVLGKVVVITAGYSDYSDKDRVYQAISSHFRPLQPLELIPYYRVSRTLAGKITFTEVEEGESYEPEL